GCKRGTALEGVLLSNADLDHTLGLFILREGEPLRVHAPGAVREALTEGLPLGSILDHYSGMRWEEPPPELEPLLCADGSPSGLSYRAFPVPGKPPRYFTRGKDTGSNHTVAYEFADEKTGGRMIYAPGVAALHRELLGRLGACDLLLFDGTFFREDELERSGVGTLLASQMGHVPVGGKGGTLEQLAPLAPRHKVYVHINNTNPMLDEGSWEHAEVLRAGLAVGKDGMDFTL
ncbi:MAG TPA: MBL fold metallo-hydrolase, partial [Planctomycetota bacterium]|nr:MBL fold metallo-hydrolase [Planctomycetota bacterium]